MTQHLSLDSGIPLPADTRGELHSPHPAAVERKQADRVLRVPLVTPHDEVWRAVRRLAYQCAAFGNATLSESYAKAKGLKAEWTTYTDHNDALSAAIRDAVGRECVGIWRRLGKKILRGEQTLGRFSADRALVIRDRGVRVKVAKGGETYIKLRLEPKPAGALMLRVFLPARHADSRNWHKQKRLAETLRMLAEHPNRITKGTIVFERPGRKIFVLLSYKKDLDVRAAGDKPGTIFALSDGTLRVECGSHVLSLSDRMYRMIAMKEHFARVQARLRAHLGKAGRRRDLRRGLLKYGSFEEWSRGPLHQLSHQIVAFCAAHGAVQIRWQIDDGVPPLPWQQLQLQVGYKAEERGILSQTSALSTQKNGLRKNGQRAGQKDE